MQLVAKRDPVTVVLATMAFVRCEIEGSKPAENYRQVVVAIAERLDAKTRELFEQHLSHRFRRTLAEDAGRLRKLRVALGLETDENAQKAGILSRLWSLLRGSGSEELESTKKNKHRY